MSTAEAPDRLLLQYRLASGVAVVSVSGEVDLATCGFLRWRCTLVSRVSSRALPARARLRGSTIPVDSRSNS